MGSMFGGGTQTTQSTQNNTPWDTQQPYLMNGLQQAQNIYNQQSAAGPYSGQIYAGQTPEQTNAAQQGANFANNAGNYLPYSTGYTAQALQGAAPSFVQNASNIASNGIQGPNAGLYGTLQGIGTGQMQTQGANPALSAMLNHAAMQGAAGLGQFQNTLQGATQQGLSDPTQRLAADASAYANNPGVQASLNNVNSQIDQTLQEQTLPGLNRQAAQGGALNSSRAGMAEGMANESAALAKGNADAQITNNAYNQGLTTAAGTYTSGLNSAINGSMFGYNDLANNANTQAGQQIGVNQFNTNAMLNAANGGLSQGLNYQLGNANTQLAANNQLGSATGLGVNAATAAGQQADASFGLGAAAGGLLQQGQQTTDNNALAQWQMQNQYQQGLLNNYWNIAGKPLGNTVQTNSSVTQPSNVLGGILGTAAGAAGLFGTGGPLESAGSSIASGIGGLFGGGGGVASALAPLAFV